MDTGGSCGGDELFALQVIGDMMEPEFEHGVVIVIDPGALIEDGSFVVAHHEDEYYFRQLVKDGEKLLLRCLNHTYTEIVELNSIDAIQGVIVQKAGKRRKDRKHYV
ncbi:MAG: S24 family peptidase [Gammaproteobacteria bacterium]